MKNQQITLSTSNRISGTPQNCVLTITQELAGHILTPKIVNMPRTYYNVNAYNNIIDVKENIGSAFAVTLTQGNYTITEFMSHVGTAMTTASGISGNSRTYTVTRSTITDRILVTGSAGTFQLLFSTGTNKLTSARKLLGFSATDTTAGLTNTADQNYDMNADMHELLIHIDVFDDFQGYNTMSVNYTYIFPITASYGDIMTDYNLNNRSLKIQNRSSNQFHLTVTDIKNRIINLNGIDWLISFDVE